MNSSSTGLTCGSGGYQPRRKLRSGMNCNSGDNRAQCRPAAAGFQAARAKLVGRRKANVRTPASAGVEWAEGTGYACRYLLRHPERNGRTNVDAPTRPCGMTPAEFEKFVVDETAKWAKVIRAANIKSEPRCRRDIPYSRSANRHSTTTTRCEPGGLLQCINLRSGESAPGQAETIRQVSGHGSFLQQETSLSFRRAGQSNVGWTVVDPPGSRGTS
jgi:hypothetical protein